MKLVSKAFHIGKRLDLRKIRKEFNFFEERREPSFLLYRIEENSYLYIKDYGSIVFLNCSLKIIDEVLQNIEGDKEVIKKTITENYIVVVGESDEIKVDFEHINVPSINTDFAHVILFNMGQSVALDNYYNQADKLLEATNKYSFLLEETGSVGMNSKRLRKFVGRTLNLKNRIAENLFIFEAPEIAWSSSDLSQLDKELNKELDIINRHNGLQHSLGVIKENLDLFKDILQHKHSSMLEGIIIALILFEIIQVFVENL